MAEINLMYVHGESIGYGRLGIDLAAALKAKGVEVYDALPEPDGDSSGESMGRNAGVANVVCWVSVPTHARGWWKGQLPVMFTMWEATKLPEAFRDTFDEFDTIVVPSWQNQELFSRYHNNVKFVPLGIDTDRWSYLERPVNNEFRFLIGGSGKRKGTDLAVKAFKKVFKTWPSDGPVPKLVMKNPRGEDFYGDRIEVIPGRISGAAETALYASSHCYVQPSRGEGFGLQPLQAIAQGMPTILTNAHGHECYSHLGYGISAELAPSDYFIYGDAGDWWEPNFDELCQSMEWVYNNYDQASAFAREASKEARSRFSLAAMADNFVEAIGPERLNTPWKQNTEWVKPQERRFLVMVNKPWQADIAGTKYYFEPNKKYYELSDVKRILFEAHLLDPRCLDVGDQETGLTPDQFERIEHYTAAHSNCPTCGHLLNDELVSA